MKALRGSRSAHAFVFRSVYCAAYRSESIQKFVNAILNPSSLPRPNRVTVSTLRCFHVSRVYLFRRVIHSRYFYSEQFSSSRNRSLGGTRGIRRTNNSVITFSVNGRANSQTRCHRACCEIFIYTVREPRTEAKKCERYKRDTGHFVR